VVLGLNPTAATNIENKNKNICHYNDKLSPEDGIRAKTCNFVEMVFQQWILKPIVHRQYCI
jgi:hypothetical protein